MVPIHVDALLAPFEAGRKPRLALRIELIYQGRTDEQDIIAGVGDGRVFITAP